jgi:hypothetical protein
MFFFFGSWNSWATRWTFPAEYWQKQNFRWAHETNIKIVPSEFSPYIMISLCVNIWVKPNTITLWSSSGTFGNCQRWSYWGFAIIAYSSSSILDHANRLERIYLPGLNFLNGTDKIVQSETSLLVAVANNKNYVSPFVCKRVGRLIMISQNIVSGPHWMASIRILSQSTSKRNTHIRILFLRNGPIPHVLLILDRIAS